MARKQTTSITTTRESNCYIVTFPAYITLENLQKWGEAFKTELIDKNDFNLIIDTNKHEFESVECLSWLRAFLTREDIIRQAIKKVAFVQPTAFRAPEIVSEYEAYFSDTESARLWLNKPATG